jgi:DsbC/DsbD-like thiol-disulfide interchange protein
MKNLPLSLVVVAVAFAAAAEKTPGGAASVEKVEIQGQARPGGNAVAVVHVKLEKDWHVQSNKPSDPNFIPTALALSPTPGVKSVTIQYPEGKAERVQGLAKPLSVYDGDFKITVLLSLDARAKLPLTIPATLTYQACKGGQCVPPKKLKLDLALGAEAK